MKSHHVSKVDRILITGAGGFLGQHIYRSLLSRSRWRKEIFAWDRESLGSFLRHSSRERAIESIQPTIVLHAAWSETSTENYEHSPCHWDWMEATAALGRYCQDNDIYVAVLGSALDSSDLNSDYARAKRKLRGIMETELAGMLLARPQWVFCRPMLRPRVLRNAISKPSFSPREPQAQRDFIAAGDVGDGIAIAVEKRLRGILYVGTGLNHSVSQLVHSPDVMDLRTANTECHTKSGEQPTVLQSYGWTPWRSDRYFHCRRGLSLSGDG